MELIKDVGVYRLAATYGSMVINNWVEYFFPSHKIEKYRNHYVVPYKYGTQSYKILCKRNRTRQRILKIVDHQNEDVTEIVKPYMGPNMDFHGMQLSPNDLGFEKITFEMLSGEIKTYDTNDIIII